MNTLSERQLEVHVPVVAWLFIVSHALFALVGGFVFVLLFGVGIVAQDAEAAMILLVVGTSVAGLLVVLAVPGIAAGFGLLARKSWGRILAIVVAVLNLLNFPIGTLLGGYALWVLLQERMGDYLAAGGDAAA